MKLTFLGTGAATSYPLPFCHCSNCRQAWELGGPSLRRRSSLLVNNDLVIDFGPDVVTSAFDYGVPLWHVRYSLLTHPHSDHFDLNHVFTRHAEYAVEKMPRLHVYAARGALPRLTAASRIESEDADLASPRYCKDVLNMQIHEVRALQPFKVGGYRVTAFPARHDPSVEPLVYAVDDGSKAVVYAVDTAALPEETWQGFHAQNMMFDTVILDHTYGPESVRLNQADHLDAFQFIQHIRRMRDEGLLVEEGSAFATHISHEGNPVHPQLSRFAKANGYEIAYDGLVVDLS